MTGAGPTGGPRPMAPAGIPEMRAFLASDAAAAITGQAIGVSCGREAH